MPSASTELILSSFFAPRVVALIGASRDERKYSGKPAKYLGLYGFSGDVTAVNPKYESIGKFSCVASIQQLPASPDLALIMVGQDDVALALEDCGRLGVRAAVVFSNGFADSSDLSSQDALVDIAGAYGIRFMGPNCLGLINSSNSFTGSFSSQLQERFGMPRRGTIGLVSQSGGLGNAALLGLRDIGLGISKWASTGNEADLSAIDFLEALVEDPETAVVCGVLESVNRPDRWRDLGSLVRKSGKPVIIMKAGRSAKGRLAAASHSGRVSGSNEVWLQFCRQHGVTAVDTIEELCQTAAVFSVLDNPRDGIASIGSGGFGVVVSDAVEESGLRMPELAESTTSRLAMYLPSAASIRNPLDPTPVPDSVYLKAVADLASDSSINTVIVLLNSLVRAYTYEFLETLLGTSRVCRNRGADMVVSYYASSDRMPAAMETALLDAGVLVCSDPVKLVRALATAVGSQFHRASLSPGPAPGVPVRISGLLPWIQGAQLLRGVGLPIVDWERISGQGQEIDEMIARMGGVVVVKLDERAVAHKSEQNYVRLGVRSRAEVEHLLELWSPTLRQSGGDVIAQRQAEQGQEVLLGFARDPEFGCTVALGAGGRLAELIADVACGILPATPDEVVELLQQTRLWNVLNGYRGGSEYDIDALVDVVLAAGSYFESRTDLTELEFNPVIVGPRGGGCVIVDILLRSNEEEPS